MFYKFQQKNIIALVTLGDTNVIKSVCLSKIKRDTFSEMTASQFNVEMHVFKHAPLKI